MDKYISINNANLQFNMVSEIYPEQMRRKVTRIDK